MRSHAKASSAVSAKTTRAALPIGAFAVVLAALALIAALASAAVPTATTGSASNIQKTTATLNGTVNPQGALLDECKFEYGTATSYGQTQACDLTPAEIGEGSSNVTVKADLTGLAIGTTYHFRLVAKNAEGTSNGSDQIFKTLSPPIVEAFATDVVYTEATINAQINPEGAATTYRFQWGPTAAYGHETEAADAGSDKSVHSFSHYLNGLAENSTYHYRVVATNANGTTETPDRVFTTYAREAQDTNCPNQAFRVGFSANLPDCRAYEMVSPVDKNGGDIETKPNLKAYFSALNQSSTDGQKFTFSSYRAFAGALSAPHSSQYLATRGADGWTTKAITPPEGNTVTTFSNVNTDVEHRFFTPDLSIGFLLYHSDPLTSEAPPSQVNLYRQDVSNQSYAPLVTSVPASAGSNPFPQLSAVAPDGEHVAFTQNAALIPAANPGTNFQVYEWTSAGLALASILPNGSPTTKNAVVGSSSAAATNVETRFASTQNAISDDGSRIFWTDDTNNNGVGQIFVRIDGTETLPISETVSTADATFHLASADGHDAIFSIGGSLYRVDVDAESSTLIGSGVSGVVGGSDDAAYVYFVSTDALAPGATMGEPNLYVDHSGSKSFVATLAAEPGAGAASNFARAPIDRTSMVTPDGRHVAFMSTRSLTGYDNRLSSSGESVAEVYIYDASTDELNCASCKPSGARPVAARLLMRGPTTFSPSPPLSAAWIQPWQLQFGPQRFLADDGDRLFFNSVDVLVPEDTNGAQDVYEWRAQGVTGCDRAAGCIDLISTGESPGDSEFLDGNASGADVFVKTDSSISPSDPGLRDVYDARIGGGYPPPPSPTGQCIGDACQDVPSPPNVETPASATFKGSGNPSAHRHRSCAVDARRAVRLSRRAKHLRRLAARTHLKRRAGTLRKRAVRTARRAKSLSKRARRCRRANQRNGK